MNQEALLRAAAQILGHSRFAVLGDRVALDEFAPGNDDDPTPVRVLLDGPQWQQVQTLAAELGAAQSLASFHEAVNNERRRRIIVGKSINGIQITGRDEDARNLTNLALGAQVRMGGGDTTTPTTFRDGDNVDHELTPPQLLSLWQQSAEYVSALYTASWTIKAMEPMPADIAADALWPSQAA